MVYVELGNKLADVYLIRTHPNQYYEYGQLVGCVQSTQNPLRFRTDEVYILRKKLMTAVHVLTNEVLFDFALV